MSRSAVDGPWRRARAPEQKAARRREIQRAAEGLFAERGFEPVGLNEIARRSGMAKANLYRYFESREAIFLAIYESDVAEWVQAVGERLSSERCPLERGPEGEGRRGGEQLSQVLAQTLSARPRLLSLISSAAVVLERNTSTESLVAHKCRILGLRSNLVSSLRRATPELDARETEEAMVVMHGLIAGLWPMSRLSRPMEAALATPGLGALRVDFERALQKSLRRVLGDCCVPEAVSRVPARGDEARGA